MILNRPFVCAHVCFWCECNPVPPGACACVLARAVMLLHMCVCLAVSVCMSMLTKMFSKCVSVYIHACACPGATGANLHTVITRCQNPPHWLWHVNYMACFHLLWWFYSAAVSPDCANPNPQGLGLKGQMFKKGLIHVTHFKNMK